MNSFAKKILFAVLIFGFAVRILGIGYGLPLWLGADEPPFVLGALKMIELKTLIPAFHEEEFRSVLYYPPYLSYLNLPLFASILFFKFISYDGDIISFANYIVSDLSNFFAAARFINIFLAVLSIYLVYKISMSLFRDEWAAAAGSFFLSTSLLHILLSFSSRQWLAVSVVYVLVLYFLTKKEFSFEKRYFWAVFSAGIGMGISMISSLSIAFIALYYLFFEEKKLSQIFREKYIYLLVLLFAVLSFVPLILYPSSIGFGNDITLGEDKNITELLLSPINFITPLFRSEPVLVLFFLLGFYFAFVKDKKIFSTFFIFLIAYSMAFYLIFRFEDRFLLALMPIIAILAGVGFKEFFRRLAEFNKIASAALLTAMIVLPIIFSLRLSYLAYLGDSRQNMRSWVEENITEGSMVLVSARLTRLSSNKEAIEEQKRIDPASLRGVDEAESYFGKNPIYPSFHALNLNSIPNSFHKNLPEYAESNSYEYLILPAEDYRKDESLHKKLLGWAKENALIISFGDDSSFSISESRLGQSPLELFETNMLGPDVSLYKLR